MTNQGVPVVPDTTVGAREIGVIGPVSFTQTRIDDRLKKRYGWRYQWGARFYLKQASGSGWADSIGYAEIREALKDTLLAVLGEPVASTDMFPGKGSSYWLTIETREGVLNIARVWVSTVVLVERPKLIPDTPVPPVTTEAIGVALSAAVKTGLAVAEALEARKRLAREAESVFNWIISRTTELLRAREFPYESRAVASTYDGHAKALQDVLNGLVPEVLQSVMGGSELSDTLRAVAARDGVAVSERAIGEALREAELHGAAVVIERLWASPYFGMSTRESRFDESRFR